jgi:tetratricopeptide (TPR) repeat protein
VVAHLARLLAEQRRAEDTLGARQLLGPVLTQIKVIDGLVRQARNPVRGAVLEVVAHYEEFAGWMYQDATDTAGALRHYDAAMEAAQEIGDADMITSVLSLKSHLAWADNDAARAIGLAAAGQREGQQVRQQVRQQVSDAVLALIAQQEARGHALDGDTDATERALDRCAALTYTAAEHPEDAPPWVYFQGPERLSFQRGVAYAELGHHADAVPLLSTALESLPDSYERDRTCNCAHLALAFAGGETLTAPWLWRCAPLSWPPQLAPLWPPGSCAGCANAVLTRKHARSPNTCKPSSMYRADLRSGRPGRRPRRGAGAGMARWAAAAALPLAEGLCHPSLSTRTRAAVLTSNPDDLQRLATTKVRLQLHQA